MRKLLVLVLALIFICGGVVAFEIITFISERPSNSSEVMVFNVAPGESFTTVAHHLEQSNLITSAFKFRLLAKLTDASTKVRVGEYAIAQNSLPREVLQIVTSGKSIEYPLTFQEGINIYDMAAIIDKQGIISGKEFLTLCKDSKFLKENLGEPLESCEGYLFPETYKITKFTGARTLMRNMISSKTLMLSLRIRLTS